MLKCDAVRNFNNIQCLLGSHYASSSLEFLYFSNECFLFISDGATPYCSGTPKSSVIAILGYFSSYLITAKGAKNGIHTQIIVSCLETWNFINHITQD